MSRFGPYSSALTSLVLIACSGAEAPAPASEGPATVGHCRYTNPFSQAEECKEYTGAAWGVNRARAECAAAEPLGIEGAFGEGPCPEGPKYGRCVVEDGDEGYALVSPGDDPAECGATQGGCETFVGGTFEPGDTCEGASTPEPPSLAGDTFVPPYEVCAAPQDDTPGQSAGGQVCTNVLVSGCTEPGRRFDDYASCDEVRTQRPFFPYPVSDVAPPDPSRLDDPQFVADLAWAKAQVGACACVCCHADLGNGTASAGWSIDADPIWTDTISDSGLAMLAGLVDSSAFGAYPPEANNGFDRDTVGLPTTDVPRMQGFLLAEYARRGLTEADAEQWPPFGGPLATQREFVPEACAEGVGVGEDGAVTWTGGPARYVYVLEADAKNPGVPPNLDLPQGTRWRLDVPLDGAPIESALTFGQVPEGAQQRFPESGTPAGLEPGETYYLYVLADVGAPITRCLFDAPR